MKFTSGQTLSKIANLLDCNFIGNADFPVLGMNEIHVVEKGDIVFVDHPKYYDKALESKASIILINKEVNYLHKIEDLQNEIYQIAKGDDVEPKEFFKVLYQIILSTTRGPKIGPFILDIGKKNVAEKISKYVK